MEAMDDETMAATTGQDGITINIVPDRISRTDAAAMGVTAPTMNAIENNAPFYKGLSIGEIRVHDNDGWTVAQGGTADTANSGALVIGDGNGGTETVVFADDTSPIEIEIDMVGDSNGATNAGGGAMLNVAIRAPKLAIATGDIYVADSYNTGTNGVDDSAATLASDALNPDDVDNAGATDGNAHRGRVKIMSGLSVVMGSSVTNIQLGNEVQTLTGAAQSATNPTGMIKLDTNLIGGLALNNFELIDAGGGITGGSIKIGQVKITNAATTGGASLNDLKVVAVVNVEDDLTTLNPNYSSATAPATEGGLVVTVGAMGVGGANIALNNVALGSATAKNLGDVQLLGLNLAGTSLIIRGH
ncbi:MAG: hypothetical protein KDI39_15545, partial [Pseudomonadales bacterium]|nr:hypothetical protein [Pseudomonadales bacterium]